MGVRRRRRRRCSSRPTTGRPASSSSTTPPGCDGCVVSGAEQAFATLLDRGRPRARRPGRRRAAPCRACTAGRRARGSSAARGGPGWALVGDAGYFKDPITTHGITDALRDAELLADEAVGVLAGAVPEAVALAPLPGDP